jgi:hypothetical protein
MARHSPIRAVMAADSRAVWVLQVPMKKSCVAASGNFNPGRGY